MRLLGTQAINGSGHLEIGGVDTLELAERFGTPLYVIDEAAFRTRCREWRRVFESRWPGAVISFAGKAFLCTAICRIVEQEGLHLDVASGGEMATALQAGFPPERISLHGNNKSREELAEALDAGIGHVIVDNFLELELLEELLHGHTRRQPALLRVAPGIDPHTHRRISTGQVDTKFGFDIGSGAALAAVRRVREIPGLDLRGFHCHVGSQLLDADCHRDSTAIMVELMAEARDRLGFAAGELNLGGGLGIAYVPEQVAPALDEFAATICSTLAAELKRRALPRPALQLEPGRSLIGDAGTTLYTAGAVKEIPGLRTYVSVDGGLSDNPRPALYDAVYNVLCASRMTEPAAKLVTVAGKHCETDLLFRDVLLPEPRPGDLLAVQCTGAYNFSMASNYNRLCRPAVVAVADGHADLLVRRETLDDILSRDLIPERLRR